MMLGLLEILWALPLLAMALDSFANVRSYILKRAGEDDTDTAGDFYDLASDFIVQAWRWLYTAPIAFLSLIKDPPGAFVTVADITTLTLTISSTGTSVSGTLSAAPSGSVSLAGYKIRPSGKTWHARITAHTADTTTITLDAVPETVTAGTACTIYKDEYELASDLGTFVNGLWTQHGNLVDLVTDEEFRQWHPDPIQGAEYATRFVRLTRRKIRLSQYPQDIRRYEYPYLYEPSDPSGSSDLAIDAHLRPVLAEKALALLFQAKGDVRQAEAEARAAKGFQDAIGYDGQRRMGLGRESHRMRVGRYGN